MRDLSVKELEKLTNLKAFNANFEPVTIKAAGKVYLIFNESPNDSGTNYIQFGSLEYINGWMYGAVQTACKIIKVKYDSASLNIIHAALKNYKDMFDSCMDSDAIQDYDGIKTNELINSIERLMR